MPPQTLPRHVPKPFSDQEMQEIIRIGNLMADAAAEVTLKYFRSGIAVDNKAADGNFDPVTEADRGAEDRIREIISRQRPEDGIFGEERGFAAGSSGYTWVIDPIDGTRSFITGVPLWGTLIALHDGDRSVFGLLDQPYLGERYYGSRLGAGLLRKDVAQLPLNTLASRDLRQAVLMSTTPDVFDKAQLQRFDRVADQVATVRYGTDCYGYAMLAAGFADLVIEANLLAYDIQALIPIIEAAGGVVTDWQGKPVHDGGEVVAASCKQTHQAALQILASS